MYKDTIVYWACWTYLKRTREKQTHDDIICSWHNDFTFYIHLYNTTFLTCNTGKPHDSLEHEVFKIYCTSKMILKTLFHLEIAVSWRKETNLQLLYTLYFWKWSFAVWNTCIWCLECVSISIDIPSHLKIYLHYEVHSVSPFLVYIIVLAHHKARKTSLHCTGKQWNENRLEEAE